MNERKAIVPTGMEAVYERIRYAPAVKVGNTVYVSGQIGRDANMKLVEEREAQIVQAFENLKIVLEAAGAMLSDVVDVTTFHTDMRDLPLFMEVGTGTSGRTLCRRGRQSALICWAVRRATLLKSRLSLSCLCNRGHPNSKQEGVGVSSETRQLATCDVVAVLPGRADDMARLDILLGHDEPIITVIGKYNHGKSRLLNELMGQEAFAVADKRETVKLSDRVHQGVRWLDAPGLDADVGTEDDRHARHAAWLHADIRLFVHAAKEGELDAKELALLAELHDDSGRTRRQTLFVLTQVDQLPSDAQLQKVSDAISSQFPGIVLNTVSSARHRKGLDEAKELFVEKSGIPLLRTELNAALEQVPAARAHEITLLLAEIRDELEQRLRGHETSLDADRALQVQQRRSFDNGLSNVIKKVGCDIELMLDALGADYASIPDTAKDAYASTAGKRERAHIQISYSRACIEIDSFLAAHGVIGLPSEQETVARALNTVMIAVMGVSVKFRKDLRRMFCTEAGRERLQREFTQYYEISNDRRVLAARISSTESSIEALQKAAVSLNAMEVAA